MQAITHPNIYQTNQEKHQSKLLPNTKSQGEVNGLLKNIII